MKYVLTLVLGVLLGLLAAARMTRPMLDAYSTELEHAERLAAHRAARLDRCSVAVGAAR